MKNWFNHVFFESLFESFGVNNGVNNVNGDLQGSDRISIGSSCCETNILMEHITVL